MAKMKKKTPKNSNKKRKNSKKVRECLIIIGIFLVFIGVLAYLFYFVKIMPSNDDVVAVVNKEKITRDDLNWWYKISIDPEYQDIVTKDDFLMLSLIPQKVLLQEAEKEGITADKEEVENAIGQFIIENGLSLDEFEDQLKPKNIGIDDIKKSFEARVSITKLLEKENIDLMNDKKSFLNIDNNAFQEYVNTLMNSSKIKIFPENIRNVVLKGFEATGDDVCNEEMPLVRLYTTSSCKVCGESGKVFKGLIEGFTNSRSIDAAHWSLDTGDNLLTAVKENGVPKEEVELFRKYSSNKVPTVVLGCKYKMTGNLGIEEEDEFKDILKSLVGA